MSDARLGYDPGAQTRRNERSQAGAAFTARAGLAFDKILDSLQLDSHLHTNPRRQAKADRVVIAWWCILYLHCPLISPKFEPVVGCLLRVWIRSRYRDSSMSREYLNKYVRSNRSGPRVFYFTLASVHGPLEKRGERIFRTVTILARYRLDHKFQPAPAGNKRK